MKDDICDDVMEKVEADVGAAVRTFRRDDEIKIVTENVSQEVSNED